MSEPSSPHESVPAESYYSPLAGFLLPLLVFLLFGIFAVLLIRHLSTIPSTDDQRAQERLAILQKMKADEAAKIGSGYGWVDASKKIVRIPIERAMELIVTELQNKPVGPAYPIGGSPAPAAPSLPAPAPAPSSTKTN